MKKIIHIIPYFLFIAITSCEKYFEPQKDNTYDDEIILSRPQYVEGLLMHAYSKLPNNYNFNTDIATDDAVTNSLSSSYYRMASGEWSSQYNPVGIWNEAYQEIYYINKFLEIFEQARYASDPLIGDHDNAIRDALHKKRLKGEAYGLRAWYKFQLLQAHSGKIDDGQLLGFPIMDENLTLEDDWKLPRNTFTECVNSILADIDVAIENLPAIYENIGEPNTDAAMGNRFYNRMNGNAAKALKSRVALFAASPAYSESNSITWEQAAIISGDFLSELGSLFEGGITFYSTLDNKELIWSNAMRSIRSWETNNFPPSLYGSGRTNPSQNLVDAFPMKNGYPISHELSDYDPDNPYSNRDKRLSDYIIYNGAKLKNTVINTYEGAPSDGIRVQEFSTRSGYYLKKLMYENVNINPAAPVSVNHVYTIFRETEIHLNFAEAANEAWGPDGDPNGYGFTARTIIENLRARAGITQPDQYLTDIISKDQMRTLIHNERRLELCFEDFRFWDIRRWNDIATMETPVKGVYIAFSNGLYSYDYREIEKRIYQAYMLYGPIPYTETLKYNLKQNKGW